MSMSDYYNDIKDRGLTHKEEREYINRYYNDGNRESYNALLYHLMLYAYRIILPYAMSPDDKMDLLQDINVKIMESMQCYDPTSDALLSTYMYKLIKGEILDYYRDRKERKKILRTDSIDNHEYDSDDVDVSDIMVNDELSDIMMSAIDHLSDSEKAVIIYKYYYQMTLCETADAAGIPKTTVSRIEGDALRKLRHPRNDVGLKEFVQEG